MVNIRIGNKTIGDDSQCFTIAEAGANHDGDLEKAIKLIDSAIEAKSDSIKFQTYTANKLVTKTAPKYWDDGKKDETQFDVFNKLDHLTQDDWKQIFEYSTDKNFLCFSTPFDEESVDLLYKFGVPAFKIASADITHLPLIKYISQKNLPIFISTGMANDLEIKEAIDTIENEGNHRIIIMHCITSYPTNPEDANLEMIRTLKKNYPEYVIGYSDHTLGTLIPTLSSIYGAKCIEKHFTYDSSLTISPDHRLSLDTFGFKTMVEQLKIAYTSTGSAIRNSFNSESESIKYARRSIVLTKKLSKGNVITRDIIDIKRPGTGISPKFLDKIIGKTLVNDVDDDIPLKWSDLGINEK
jgi:sialic acid synthase SpsE